MLIVWSTMLQSFEDAHSSSFQLEGHMPYLQGFRDLSMAMHGSFLDAFFAMLGKIF